MTDPRIQRLAHTMVHYSVSIQPGENVALLGDMTGLPLLHELYKEIILAGANCAFVPFDGVRNMSYAVVFADADMADFLLRNGNPSQLAWTPPMERWIRDESDATIIVRSSANTRRSSSIPPQVSADRSVSRRKYRQDLLRSAGGNPSGTPERWSVTLFPTEALAQEADMSLREFEDFAYRACFADQPDPIQSWRDLAARQQKYVDWLAGRKRIELHGPNIAMTLSIEGRTFINSTATHNMPSGEIFTGPVEESVNGWVRFSYPAIRDGRAVEGAALTFEQGKVVKASAQKNEDYLLAQLDSDPGARYLGEWAIGTNYGINRFIGNILFDEKIGGTIHMALGNSYEETGGKNKSAIHWDMLCDMRQDSEIIVDGGLLYKNGQFVI